MLPAKATVRNKIQGNITNKKIKWILPKESNGSLKTLLKDTEYKNGELLLTSSVKIEAPKKC